MDLNCTYEIEEVLDPPHYRVHVTKAQISKEGSVVNSIKGIHIEGKSNEDVQILCFHNSNMNFIPKGLCKIFPNLVALLISKCGLKKITAEDLDGLENLKQLQISDNQLTTLPSNLLQNMKKLEWFFCHEPKLEYLSAKLLSSENVNSLKFVSLKNNKNIDLRFPGNCSTLDELKDAIATNYSPPQMEVDKFTKNLKLVEKFWQMWTSGDLSDFTIESGRKKFKVHKNVLIYQSSILAKAVQSGMEESKSSRMRIDDFSSDAVQEFLKYFYTGEISEVNAMEIFGLAAKYDVPALLNIMEGIVAENVDEKNALEVLKFGNLHESEIIMKAAFKVIKTVLSDIELPEEMMKKPEDLLDLLEAKRIYKTDMGAANEKYKKAVNAKKFKSSHTTQS